MTDADVLDAFRKAGALLEGHFILSSGRHSPVFLQKAHVFSHPETAEHLCRALANKLAARHGRIDVVCGPAIGGLIPAYETARALGCRAIYTERDNGVMALRRGFSVRPDERLVIVEDIVTTAASLNETIRALQDKGASCLGAGCIIDRSGGRSAPDCPLTALCLVDFPDFPPDAVPPELASIPPLTPGSRGTQ